MPHPEPRLREQLSQYVDGELSSAERRRIEQHLRRCAACAALCNEYRRAGTAIRRPSSRRPPPELRRSVYRQIEEVGRGRRREFWWLLPLPRSLANAVAGGVALAALLFLVILGFRAADLSRRGLSIAASQAPVELGRLATGAAAARPTELREEPATGPPSALGSEESRAASGVSPPATPIRSSTVADAPPVTVAPAAPPDSPALSQRSGEGAAPAAGQATPPLLRPEGAPAATSTGGVSASEPPHAASPPAAGGAGGLAASAAAPSAPSAPSGDLSYVRLVGKVDDVQRSSRLLRLQLDDGARRLVTVPTGVIIALGEGPTAKTVSFEQIGLGDRLEVRGTQGSASDAVVTVTQAQLLTSPTLALAPPEPAARLGARVLYLHDGVETLRRGEYGENTGEWLYRLQILLSREFNVQAVDPQMVSELPLQGTALVVIGWPATLSKDMLERLRTSGVATLNGNPQYVQPLGQGTNANPSDPRRTLPGRTVEISNSLSRVLEGLPAGHIEVARDGVFRNPINTTHTVLAWASDGNRRYAIWTLYARSVYFGFWKSLDGTNHLPRYWTLFDRSVNVLLGRDTNTGTPGPATTAAPVGR